MYDIPDNITGPELNDVIYKTYNRQGTQCRQCIDGYGPAPFSDGVTCADFSKYKHLWVLHLFFQLMMVTLMYLAVIVLQVKGNSSTFNIMISYCQLGVNIAI